MHALGRLWLLSPSRRRLIAEALLRTVGVRIRLFWRRGVALTAEVSDRHEGVDMAEVAWAIELTGRYTPGSTCLVRALAMQRMLARRGKSAEVRVGVAREGPGLEAHAWLVCDGKIVVGGDGAERYTELSAG